MDKLGLKDGEMIQHQMITRSIERAQKKVEENNFGIRKRLLEYDDVMNAQREVIYKKRRHALLGERLSVDIANMMYDVTENIVETYHNDADFEGFDHDLIRSFSVDSPVREAEFTNLKTADITETVFDKVQNTYKRKVESISEQAYPVLKDVYDRMAHQFENVVVPVTDGIKVYQVVTNLKATVESEGKELARAYEKTAVLATIDDSWKEHLREMDDLKQAVQNATYEQKDPLLIYKFESFDLFKTMLNKVNKEVISLLMKGYIPRQNPDQVRVAERRRQMDMSNLRASKSDFSQYSSTGGGSGNKRVEPVRVEKKVGRNEPCPCGSGKKYKQCHGTQQGISPM
jgi:preprotein translocase subunit SecA